MPRSTYLIHLGVSIEVKEYTIEEAIKRVKGVLEREGFEIGDIVCEVNP